MTFMELTRYETKQSYQTKKMEKFSLKWNDYQSNVSKSFQSLRHKEDYCDVTLVGDDFKQVTAHKVILSSCSEYFDNVLRNSKNHTHPLLCLEGLKFKDIQNIMDYVYHGELKIYQEDIDRFLEIAQRLKLEGLIGQDSTSNESIYEETKAETFSQEHSEFVAEEINVKAINPKERKMVLSSSNEDLDTMEKLNKKVQESYSKGEDGLYYCLYCSRTSKNPGHIREHVEVHFDGLALKCDHCDKTLRSRNALRRHIYQFHRN